MIGGMLRRAVIRDLRRSSRRRGRARKVATGYGTVAHGQRRRAAKLAAQRASAAQVQAARAAAASAARTSEPQRNRWGLAQPDPNADTIAGRWGV